MPQPTQNQRRQGRPRRSWVTPTPGHPITDPLAYSNADGTVQTDCLVLSIQDATFKQLYFQHPKFAFTIGHLITHRLTADIERLQRRIAAMENKEGLMRSADCRLMRAQDSRLGSPDPILISIKDAVPPTGVEAASLSWLLLDGGGLMNRRDSVLALLAMGAAGGGSLRSHRGNRRKTVSDRAGARPTHRWLLKRFASALRELGRIEGRDYVFHRSGVFYGPDTQLAVDRVVEAKPDLILTGNLGYAMAAQKASMTVPVVLYASGFPVEGGVADSLTRPGKNVTGMTSRPEANTFGKLVQLVHEAKPTATRIGVFMSYVPPFHPRAESRPHHPGNEKRGPATWDRCAGLRNRQVRRHRQRVRRGR